jgi:hypothetical protein
MTLPEALTELFDVTPVMAQSDVLRGLKRKGHAPTDAELAAAMTEIGAAQVEPHWRRDRRRP